MKQITCPHCGDTYPDFDVAHVCSRGPYAPRLKPKMNERIGQLAEQAGLVKILEEHAHEYGGGTFENTPYPELEKFAELIRAEHTQSVIKLCANTINDNLNAEKQRRSNRWDNVKLVLIIIGMVAWVTFWYIQSH